MPGKEGEEREGTIEGQEDTIVSDCYVWFRSLDYVDDFMDIYICQNLSNYAVYYILIISQ